MKILNYIIAIATVLSLTAAQISYAADTVSSSDAGVYYSPETSNQNSFHYKHDPRLNSKAMEDICADANAVYGFSPNPDSDRLGSYASFDWSDPDVVESGRKDRIAYHDSIKEMYAVLDELISEGKTDEEIANVISPLRNELRIAANADDPEKLAVMKESNLKKYGNENGPTPQQLFEQYGSWKTVIEKAFSVNAGMDVCLGLYDDYYELYIAVGQILPENEAEASREYAISAFMQAADSEIGYNNLTSLKSFSDADTISEWYIQDVANAVSEGIIAGYDDGTLKPERAVSRIEAMVILARCLPKIKSSELSHGFADVPSWANDEIMTLVSAGIVDGYGDGTLGAYDALTVEQVKLLTQRAVSFTAE